jgi:Uma2 family endonuclease
MMVSNEVARRQITVDEYYRKAEAGILRADDRVELIEGEILEMLPIGSRHASVVDQISAALYSQMPDQLIIVRVLGPVRLSNLSEPIPDIVLLQPRADLSE